MELGYILLPKAISAPWSYAQGGKVLFQIFIDAFLIYTGVVAFQKAYGKPYFNGDKIGVSYGQRYGLGQVIFQVFPYL